MKNLTFAFIASFISFSAFAKSHVELETDFRYVGNNNYEIRFIVRNAESLSNVKIPLTSEGIRVCGSTDKLVSPSGDIDLNKKNDFQDIVKLKLTKEDLNSDYRECYGRIEFPDAELTNVNDRDANNIKTPGLRVSAEGSDGSPLKTGVRFSISDRKIDSFESDMKGRLGKKLTLKRATYIFQVESQLDDNFFNGMAGIILPNGTEIFEDSENELKNKFENYNKQLKLKIIQETELVNTPLDFLAGIGCVSGITPGCNGPSLSYKKLSKWDYSGSYGSSFFQITMIPRSFVTGLKKTAFRITGSEFNKVRMDLENTLP